MSLFNRIAFCLEITTDTQNVVIGYLVVIFSKINKASLPFQGKQLRVVFVDDKIWTFK